MKFFIDIIQITSNNKCIHYTVLEIQVSINQISKQKHIQKLLGKI